MHLLAHLSTLGFENIIVTPRGERINVGTDDEGGSEIDPELTTAGIICAVVDLLSPLRCQDVLASQQGELSQVYLAPDIPVRQGT